MNLHVKWDGEPLKPEVCKHCGKIPCICEKHEPDPCPVCGNDPCVCNNPPKQITRVKLSDNKVRELDKMIKTSFYSPTGKPISAEEFIKQLFGDIPSFFKSEEELRKLWSVPSTRKRLLEELNEKGYTNEQLADLSKLVHGEDCDLYDVLSYVAYHKNLVPRLERADRARIYLDSYDKNQQEFLDFVLNQYVKEGVSELDDAKLPDILELKYQAIADAKTRLGEIKIIRETFIGFQEYLYKSKVI